MIKDNKAELVFLPLGGVGEIGMNLALYGYGNKKNKEWIIIDFGVGFADFNTPGADLIFPNIDFLLQEKANIKAIILTHAHEDHYGAVAYLWSMLEIPVYASPFTIGLLEVKCKRDGNDVKIPVNIFQAGDMLKLGNFEIEGVSVTHSIPEPMTLCITTPLGRVIHTGDWKIDISPAIGKLTDETRLKQLGDEGILALICDSTNAMVKGSTPSEKTVNENIVKLLNKIKGRVFIAVFSSNIGRIYSITKAAEAVGRRVLLVGSSIKTSVSIAKELGYLSDIDNIFLSEEEYSTIDRDKIVVIITGSQGETRAALARIAKEEMRFISMTKGDTVIFSSRAIPGNEKAIIAVQNNLVDLGVNIIDAEDNLIHVSGHPAQDDLATIYGWVKPNILVPVHGEPLHLRAHAKFAKSKGIKNVVEIRNGQILKLAPNNVEVIEEVEVGRLYKDGKLIGTEAELGITERKRLSYNGHISVTVILNNQGDFKIEPQIVEVGVPIKNSTGKNFGNLFQVEIKGVVTSIPHSRRKNTELVKEAIRRAVRAVAFREWGKKPITSVFVYHED
ncbi:ribonuclease J [Bartonella sp. DGB1]|uniref:ribonuclease J n=1 Tax=Bartonella sp. DGB1 TaxID=3239807 RepID=UPI003524D337